MGGTDLIPPRFGPEFQSGKYPHSGTFPLTVFRFRISLIARRKGFCAFPSVQSRLRNTARSKNKFVVKQLSPDPAPGNLRVFIACLLSFSILMAPFASMAAAKQRSEVRGQKSEKTRGDDSTNAKAAADNLFVNGPIPEPAPQPPIVGTPTIVATMTDNRPGTDPASAKPTETINYTVTIQNTSTADGRGIQFNDDVDAHTTF